MAKEAKKQGGDQRVPVVSVRTAGRGTFWRAGFQFTEEERVLYSDEVDAEKLELLRNERALVVADVVAG